MNPWHLGNFYYKFFLEFYAWFVLGYSISHYLQSVDKILPVYAILQNKKVYQKNSTKLPAWKLVQVSFVFAKN